MCWCRHHLSLSILFCALFGFQCTGELGAPAGDGGAPVDEEDGAVILPPPEFDGGIDTGDVISYIWIANSAEGTVSKLNTANGEEVARYFTGPQEATSDPSRTSVNLYGDAVVTNRDPYPDASSVTKFAADEEDCIDRSGNGLIETSHGPNEVLRWGEDECMLWNTPLTSELDEDWPEGYDDYRGFSLGARATAWDGAEDPSTGLGGSVWIGSFNTGEIFQLDGDNGEVIARTQWRWDGEPAYIPGASGHGTYGGAMDGRGNFWVFDGGQYLGRVNTSTLQIDTFEVPCGYGIAVDSQDRVWTSGSMCVNRFDPDTEENTTYFAEGCSDYWEGDPGGGNNDCFFRGLAVDGEGSVWVAETSGAVLRINEDRVEFVSRVSLGAYGIVGVAVDYFGQVWAVSQSDNAALRIDPDTSDVESFPVGFGPYTYSDMTGHQLRTVMLY